ncbi:MAG: enoyl-CoA hydratase/isomerase family protein [Chloroflexi bacterium]|nr:enoyl-CoA hydratase/isomerase family protein [Chloroflexota bacterium]
MSDEILIEQLEQGITRLILNRPQKLNAINVAMRVALDQALDVIDASPETRVLILAAAPCRAFSVGGDIDERKAMTPEEIRRMRQSFSNPYQRLYQARPPVIAAISGFCLGGGLELALAADFRIADETAEFGLPEVTLGVIPAGGGTQRLPRLIGLSQAKRLIFTGARIKAPQALAIGMVDEVCETGALDETVLNLAHSIAKNPPLAVAEAKRCLNLGFPLASSEGLALEAESYLTCIGSPERATALQAYAERKANRADSTKQ